MKTDRMKAMFTIVDRSDGIALSKLYEQNGVPLHLQIIAEGTATSEVLNMLGLTRREKVMLASVAPEAAVEALLSRLDNDYRGILSVRGLAFSIQMTGISGAIASALSTGNPQAGGATVNSEREHSVIFAAVNQGCTDQVMQTACKAGATGGTVLRGRWVGAQRLEKYHAISLQDEKELLMIVCDRSIRNAIMDAINERHGLRSEEQAFVFSLPIDRMVKLS